MNDQFGLDEAKMLNDPRSKMWPWIVLERDGDMICAHLNDFVNLQESPAGFGKTIKESVSDLLVNRKLHCHKAMWSGYGAPAGTCDEPAFTDEIHPNTLAMILCQDISRCPKHGGFDLGAAASLAIHYRIDQTNRITAMDWETV